jgi:pilus assembly protein Flp/PilA
VLYNALFWLRSVLHRDEGATMVEYGLMVALIAVVAMITVAAVGTNLFGLFGNVADKISGG